MISSRLRGWHLGLGSRAWLISFHPGWPHSRACGQLLVNWMALFLGWAGCGMGSGGDWTTASPPPRGSPGLAFVCLKAKPPKQKLQGRWRAGLRTHRPHLPPSVGQTMPQGHSRSRRERQMPLLRRRSWRAVWPFLNPPQRSLRCQPQLKAVSDSHH